MARYQLCIIIIIMVRKGDSDYQERDSKKSGAWVCEH